MFPSTDHSSSGHRPQVSIYSIILNYIAIPEILMVLPRSIFGLVPTMRIHAVPLLSFDKFWCRHWWLIPRGPRSFEPGVPTQTWRGSSSPTSSPWDALHSWDPASHWFEQFELLPLVTWIPNLAGLVQGKNLQETMFFPCKSSLKIDNQAPKSNTVLPSNWTPLNPLVDHHFHSFSPFVILINVTFWTGYHIIRHTQISLLVKYTHTHTHIYIYIYLDISIYVL